MHLNTVISLRQELPITPRLLVVANGTTKLMTSKYQFLLDEEQMSNDFSLLTDGTYFYAVRADSEGPCHFAIKDKSKMIVVSEAVDIISNYILSKENLIKKVPSWDMKTKKVVWN